MLLAIALLGGVTVALPPSAEVGGLDVTVEEIATVRGDDDAVVARVASARLGYAPAPGYHRVLRADLVEAALRRALPDVELDVVGAPTCRVTPLTESIPADRIREAARARLAALLEGADAEATLRGQIAGIVVPRGEAPAEVVAQIVDRDVAPGPKDVQVQVLVDGEIYRTLHTSWSVALFQRRAVLRAAVEAGAPLDPGAFEIRRVAVTHGRLQHALPIEALQGAVASRALAAGSVVTERDVHREVLVRRGDLVSVRVTKGAVTASDLGTVQSDGRAGERVRVVLRSTGRELVDRVRSRELVEVTVR